MEGKLQRYFEVMSAKKVLPILQEDKSLAKLKYASTFLDLEIICDMQIFKL